MVKLFNKEIKADDFIKVQNNILEYIYSKEVKQILKANANSLSLQQWATLAIYFGKDKKFFIFQQLSNYAQSTYEKKLFKVSLKDIKKFNDIEDKSTRFYQKNDPRERKPSYPFEEKIDLEIQLLFDYGDIVTYEDDIKPII